MAVARRGSQQALVHTATAVSSLSVSLPSAATAGDMVALAIFAYNHLPPTSGATDNQSGNTYNRVKVGAQSSASPDGNAALYVALGVNASGTFTLTYTPGGSQIMTIAASEYSGVATSVATDVSNNAVTTGTTTPVSGTTATTSQADEVGLAVMAYGGTSNVAVTTSSPWTTVRAEPDASQYQTGAFSDRILTATGTQSCTWGTQFANADALIITFKGAGGGGGGTTFNLSGSTTQAQSLTLPAKQIRPIRSLTQSQTLALIRQPRLIRAMAQAQTLALRQAVVLSRSVVQAQVVGLVRQVRLTRGFGQAQSASAAAIRLGTTYFLTVGTSIGASLVLTASAVGHQYFVTCAAWIGQRVVLAFTVRRKPTPSLEPGPVDVAPWLEVSLDATPPALVPAGSGAAPALRPY